MEDTLTLEVTVFFLDNELSGKKKYKRTKLKSFYLPTLLFLSAYEKTICILT